jgi:hypothetical protein
LSILNQLLSFDFWKKDPTSKSLAKDKGLVGVCNTFVEFIKITNKNIDEWHDCTHPAAEHFRKQSARSE